MKEKLQSLIGVRKIIALSITLLFIILAIMGKVDSKLVEYTVTSVISFYFGKSTALGGVKTGQAVAENTSTSVSTEPQSKN
jgi:hypothetical protein